MRISPKQENELRRLAPERADKLIKDGNWDEIHFIFEEAVLNNLDENSEPTEESRRIERIMDSFHWYNYVRPNDEFVE